MGKEYEDRVKNILDEKYRELFILHLKEKWKDLLRKLNEKERKELKRLKKSQISFYKYLRIIEGFPHIKALKKMQTWLIK